jgi:hypothetical protein
MSPYPNPKSIASYKERKKDETKMQRGDKFALYFPKLKNSKIQKLHFLQKL